MLVDKQSTCTANHGDLFFCGVSARSCEAVSLAFWRKEGTYSLIFPFWVRLSHEYVPKFLLSVCPYPFSLEKKKVQVLMVCIFALENQKYYV